MKCWDTNRIKIVDKLLKPGSRPHALLFYGMGGIGKKCWPCILQNVFMQVCVKKVMRYLRELPFDGY